MFLLMRFYGIVDCTIRQRNYSAGTAFRHSMRLTQRHIVYKAENPLFYRYPVYDEYMELRSAFDIEGAPRRYSH